MFAKNYYPVGIPDIRCFVIRPEIRFFCYQAKSLSGTALVKIDVMPRVITSVDAEKTSIPFPSKLNGI